LHIDIAGNSKEKLHVVVVDCLVVT
jgi:hypothetical protein